MPSLVISRQVISASKRGSSEARNGRLMALGRDNFHDGGEEQIFGAK